MDGRQRQPLGKLIKKNHPTNLNTKNNDVAIYGTGTISRRDDTLPAPLLQLALQLHSYCCYIVPLALLVTTVVPTHAYR